jgi:hypothetical protein
LPPKPLGTSARLSSLTWNSGWRILKKRTSDYEQAWASLNSHPPTTINSSAPRENRYRPARTESSRRGSRVWRAGGRLSSKRCRPQVSRSTSKYHLHPPPTLLFPRPPHPPALFLPSYPHLRPPTPSHQLLQPHHSRVRIFLTSSSPLAT